MGLHVSCPSNPTIFRGVGWALQGTYMKDVKISIAQMNELFLELKSTHFFLLNLLIKTCMVFSLILPIKILFREHWEHPSLQNIFKINQQLPDGIVVTHSFDCLFLSSPIFPHFVKIIYKSDNHNLIFIQLSIPFFT